MKNKKRERALALACCAAMAALMLLSTLGALVYQLAYLF